MLSDINVSLFVYYISLLVFAYIAFNYTEQILYFKLLQLPRNCLNTAERSGYFVYRNKKKIKLKTLLLLLTTAFAKRSATCKIIN